MSDLLNKAPFLQKMMKTYYYTVTVDTIANQNISIFTLKFIKDSHRFDNLLFQGICVRLEVFSILLHALNMTMYYFFCCSCQYILSMSIYVISF